MNQNQFKITIASGKGGVGKSMIASGLAMLFAKDKKIIAVDADVDAPNLAVWLGGIKKWDKVAPVTTSAKPAIDMEKCNGCGLCAKNCYFEALEMVDNNPKLNPFVCEGCGVCQIVCPQKAVDLNPVQNGQIKSVQTKYGFTLVSGQLLPGETGSGKVVTEIKKEAENISKGDYQIMIIDSAPGTGCPVIASLQDSNFALLITEPTPSGLSDLKRVLEVVNHFSIPYQVVINKWDINPQLSRQIEKEFKGNLLGKISYNQAIFKAVVNFQPILETNLKTKEEIEKLFENLFRIYEAD